MDRDLLDLTRRFRLAVRLTVLVVVAALGDRIPGVPLAYIAPPRFWVWFQLVLSVPIVLWSGAPFFRRAARSIVRFRPDRFTLVALGVAAVWIYSLVAALRPDLFPEAYRDDLGNVTLQFEAATVIVTLALVGWLIEERAFAAAAGSIRAMLAVVPKTARRLRPDGFEENAAVADLRPGDLVRVWPRETVPLDGVVIEGSTAVDESAIGGAATPVEKGPGDPIASGASNRGAALLVRVETVAGETALARRVRLALDAQRSSAPIGRWADRLAAGFSAAALALAAVTFAAWATRGPEPRLALATLDAVAVLIAAAPAAFTVGAAMPLAVTIARGAKVGIEWRSAAAVESGDIALLESAPDVIARARRLSRAALSTVKQNLLFAFLYNSLALTIASGVLHPYLGIRLDPTIAAAAAALSSVVVIANAARLRWVKADRAPSARAATAPPEDASASRGG